MPTLPPQTPLHTGFTKSRINKNDLVTNDLTGIGSVPSRKGLRRPKSIDTVVELVMLGVHYNELFL